ncbi:ClpP/crotonase [Aulographum hederae CBS 113979]|uniref:ClpP/crotonase n=1 Tax=Aulographum hederae CBS 113979 TaxID=1176131 RepID=A0A6G1H0W7_9PEZI|nr:ClpP/crotonase [Aulographum hederae CBS 113979]
MSKPLFTIPIAHTNGTVEVTTPAERVYLLTFNSPPDNRLHSLFIDAFSLALDILEHRYPHGVLITTSKIAKFYSNGLDIDHAFTTPHFYEQKWFPFYQRILTYPMPTIALLPGHAFAGGFMLAMFHDYRIMSPTRGFLCLNEIDIGMVMPAPLISIFREKVAHPNTFRAVALEGKRFTGAEALKEGLVDGLGDGTQGFDEATKLIKEKNLLLKTKHGIWGAEKEEMYRQTIGFLRTNTDNSLWREKIETEKRTRKVRQLKGVEEWETSSKSGLSKL